MMRLSLFPRVTITQGREIDTPWHEFATGYLNHHLPQLTKDGELYSGAVYESGNIKREDANVIGMTAVVFDVDNKADSITRPEDHAENLAGLTYAWHSTFSSTPDHPRFRIILPLDRMVSPHEWPAVFRGAMALVGNDPAIDASCGDLSRAYWRPAYHPANAGQEFAGFQDGERVKADDLLELAGSQPEPTIIQFKPPPLPRTVPLGPPRHEGRNDALKAQVAACMAKGKGLDDMIKEVMDYDQRVHTVPLFSDPSENRNPDAYTNAVRFVTSIMGSINTRRQAQGLPAEIPGSSQDEPVAMGFLSLSEIRSSLKGAQYLVKPYLERETTAVMFGESGTYKSFICLDIGLSIAYGIPYHGHRTHKSPVFYVCGEGSGGIARRIEAWMLAHPKQAEDSAPFYVSKVPACLIEDGNAAGIAAAIQQQEPGINPGLIIMDTLSTNIGDGDESSNPDVAKLMNNVNVHLRDVFGCCVLIVHHVGHGDKDRERGAYALRGNADARIQVKPDGDHKCSMHSLKVKDGPEFDPVAFSARVVTIPGIFDSEGEAVASLVLDRSEYVEPERSTDGRQASQALVILRDMFTERRNNLSQRGDDPAGARVEDSCWYAELERLEIIKPGASRQAKNNLKRKLKDQGMIDWNGRDLVLL